MPKDQRFYMTFPIEFPEHPKVKPLSVLAKWTFVEMNAYSRRLGLDGRIPGAAARATWAKKPLAELVASHPERPLVLLDGDDYVLREYAEHQQTTDAIEELREKRANAGSKGGKAKAERKQTGSKPVASAMAKGKQTLAESESESESEKNLDVNHLPQSSHEGDVEASQADFSEVVIMKARRSGIQDLAAVRQLLASTCGPISAGGAVELVDAITARAQGRVRDVDAYVATACRNSPDDVRWDYERLDLAVAS